MSIMKGLYAQGPGLLRRRGAVITAFAAVSLAVAMTAIALLAPAGTQAQSAAETPAQNANTMAITEMSVVVTGTWTSSGYVTLDWEAPAGASDSTVYRMYRDNGKRNDIYIGGPSRTTTGAEGTSFRHFFWNTPGSWLTYWVLAEHPEGAYDPPHGLKGNRGTLSGPYHAQVPPAGPSAPTNPTATVNDAGHVVVSWGRPTTNAETGGLHYHIQRTSRGGTPRTPYSVPNYTSATSITDTSVLPAGKYTYRIEAHTGGAAKPGPIAKVKVAVPAGAPQAPRQLAAVDATANSATLVPPTTKTVTLTWNSPAWDGGKDIRHYQVRRENTRGKGKNLGTVAAGAVTYTDDTARANKTYIYKVRAKNKFGYGPWTTVRFRTPR